MSRHDKTTGRIIQTAQVLLGLGVIDAGLSRMRKLHSAGFWSKNGPTGQMELGNPMRHANGTRSSQSAHEAHSQGVEEGTKSQSSILGVRTDRCEKGFERYLASC